MEDPVLELVTRDINPSVTRDTDCRSLARI